MTREEKWGNKSPTTEIIEWYRGEDTTEKLLQQTRRHVWVCQDSWYYLISINVKQRWRLPISFLFQTPSFPFSSSSLSLSSPSLYLYPVQLYVWLGTGVENRSRLKHGRAHLHDMNIMERAGSPANSGYERALPVERRVRGSPVTHRMYLGSSTGSLSATNGSSRRLRLLIEWRASWSRE